MRVKIGIIFEDVMYIFAIVGVIWVTIDEPPKHWWGWILFLLFLIVQVMIVFRMIIGIARYGWLKWALMERKSVKAKVVSRRTDVMKVTYTDKRENTILVYYATFEIGDGEHIEFQMRKSQYESLVEGAYGTLRCEGNHYSSFVPQPVK